jgi:2,7-dihydroxy-5-methyl-1-naphthoate 7-O-methyltransferase
MDLFTLSDLCTPWCVHVVATLRIAQHLEAGLAQVDDLARAAKCDAPSLHRVLRHLASKGVFVETASGRFALNENARLLLEPAARWLDLDAFGGRMAHAWSTMLSAVRNGKPAYDQVFGRPYWDDLAAHPEIAADFDDLMGPAGHGVPDPNVLIDGDWDLIRTVVDVGGGTGTLLAEVLKAHPRLRGTLVDMPRTVEQSCTTFQRAGVADRVTIAAQSFFDPLPSGADLYMLKSVLSDWPDTEAKSILERCAEAARPHGRLVVVNGVSPDGLDAPDPNLLMMVLVGGKERSLSEFRSLAQSAGLKVEKTSPKGSERFLVECRPL